MTEVLEPTVDTTGPAFEPSRAARGLLATLSAAAGVIHLVMAPSHWDASWVEGVAFVAAGWFQLLAAWFLTSRASRGVLHITVAANGFLVGAWAWSRVFGLPFGAQAGHAETVGFVDGTAVGLEAALVVGSLLVLLQPEIGRAWSRRTLALAAVVPIAVVALATAAIASPSARDHAAGSHGDHGADGGDETAAVPGDGDVVATENDGHAHDQGGGTSTEDSTTVAIDGREVTGVKAEDIAHEELPNEPLDKATRDALKLQLLIARDTALRYPTVADATAAGYFLAGGFGPGSGAHYIGGRFGVGSFDATGPTALIYDGTSPTSEMVGLMYTGAGANGAAPDGFAGPNDHWHRHSGVCTRMGEGLLDVVFPVDADVTAEQCEAAGGNYMDVTTWMVHAWVVPSWESPLGVFSHDNPDLRCADGTFDTDEIGRCRGT